MLIQSQVRLNNLKESIHLSHGPKIGRLLRAPRKILFSELVKVYSKLTGAGLRVRANTFYDVEMLLVLPESVSESLYRYGYFEEGLTLMVMNYVKEGGVFFDIGAHYGYFTLLASTLVGDTGQVHSFEPTPSTFSILSENTAKLKNVTVNNVAVYSSNQTIGITDYGLKYSSFNSIYKGRLSDNGSLPNSVKEYSVSAVSVDSYVKSSGVVPGFVKIDAESAEFQILEGMNETILKAHPIISVEVGDKGGSDVPLSRDLVLSLCKKGYIPYEYSNAGSFIVHAPKLDSPYLYDNLLFLPK